ncbi:FUSC family protein [Fulvimarina sp. MAC3]|uniref:FUSC family protein n=1 Tax=Fulvimarina sp. MAC3 TaxID=3148887 RepID=UPI0031FCE211
MNGLRRGLASLGARIATSDPSRARLRMALRTTLTVIGVGIALALAHLIHPLPFTAYGVGIVTALQGALAVRDIGTRQRAITRFWCGLAGLASIGVVTLLLPVQAGVEMWFLVVIFGAVYIRRFGVRWNAVGMYAFMCTFIAGYLKPGAGDLGGIAVAILISSVVAHILRNTVLPERRSKDFEIAIIAVGSRARSLSRLFALAGSRDAGALRETLIGAENELRDALLVADGDLPVRAASETAEPARRAMAECLMDVQVIAEIRTAAIFAERPDRAFEARIDARFHEALGRMHRLARELPAEAFEGKAVPLQRPPAPQFTGLVSDPALRTALQVTLATGIAMGGGLLLSPTRWFWAILTAFLVFTNVQSRGDTLIRGLSRAVGTLLGIVFGIGLATLLAGDVVLSSALAIVSIFVAFYFLIVSYAVMTFFITIAISLIYGLIGVFTPDLLILRLEETLIGALAGIFVSFVVFPRTARGAADDAARDYFKAAQGSLSAISAALRGEHGADKLALERALDRSYDGVVTAARGIGSPWQMQRRPGPVRRTLFRMRGLAHFVHVLGGHVSRGDLSGVDREALASEVDSLAAKLEQLAAQSGYFDKGSLLPPVVGSTDVTNRDEPRLIVAVMNRIVDGFLAEGR